MAAGRNIRQGRGNEPVWLRGLQNALSEFPVIRRFETVTIADIHGEKVHTPEHPELVHVQQGEAEIRYRRRSFRVGPGDTFIIPGRTAHRDCRASETPCRFCYIFFVWPSGNDVLRQTDPRVYLEAPAVVKAHLHALMNEFESDYMSNEPNAADRLRLILMEMVIALVRCSHRRSSGVPEASRRVAAQRRGRLAFGVRDFLAAHYGEPVNLNALAERHHVSPVHLSRTFSQEFGMSITDMLTMIRIERAKDFLREGDLSIKQVAARTGYSNGNYFARVFRRVCGFSPSEYQVFKTR